MKAKILSITIIVLLTYSGCSYKSFDVNYLPLSTAYLNNNDTTSIIRFLPSNKMVKLKKKDNVNYHWIDTNQIIHVTRGNYSGKLLHGSFEENYPNKNLFVSGEFKNGIRIGIWYYYHLNGQIHYKVKWKDGLKKGIVRYYSSEQKLLRSTPYSNGLKHGLECVYQDSMYVINKYKKGILTKSQSGKY